MASELQDQENEISVKLSNTEDSDASKVNPSDTDCMPSSCNEESLSKDSVNTNNSDLYKSVASKDIPGTEPLDDQIDEDAVLCGDETEKDINIDSNNIDEDELLKDTECDVVGSSEPIKSTFLTNSVDSITENRIKITDCDSQSVADGLDKIEAISVGNVENANLDLNEMVAVTNESESICDALDIGKVCPKENQTGDTKELPQDAAHSIIDKRDEGSKENVNGITNGQNIESSNVSNDIQNKLMEDENISKDGEDSHNALSMDENSTTNLMDSGDDDDNRQTKFLHVDQDSVPEEPMDMGDNAVDPFAHTSDSPERQQQSSEMETVEAEDSSMTADKPVGENSSNAENLLEDKVEGDSTTSTNEENKSGNEKNNEILTQDKESESENQKGHDEDFCIIPDKMPGEEKSKDSSSICKDSVSSDISKDMEIDLTVEKSDSSHSEEKDGRTKEEKTHRKSDSSSSSSDAEVQQSTPSRPQRQAAKKAESQIKQAALAESADIEEIDSEVDDPDDPDDPESDIQECQQCGKVRPCKISVITYGKTNYYCGEECFARLRRFKTVPPNENESAEKQPEVQPGVPETEPVGESLVQNEENLENDKQTTVIPQDRSEFVRKCSQCSSIINADERTLSWETMDFCHEDCLGKYQMKLGSHCANCKGNVQAASLGKYCVRFGYDIKQFCCAACLEEFKKGLKVCSFCQKDISSGTEGFLAPVGDKGQFKDFCTQACMEKYEQMSSNQPPPPQMHPCDVCNNEKMVMVEVMFDKKINKLCSEVCFNAFKFVNTLSVDRCDMCKKYFDKDNSDRESFSVFYDNAPHNFCCKTCMNVYILSKRKIVPCNWCKVKKYNFDMIKRVLNTGQMLMMCSLNCLTLYQVSVNAVSSRRIKCDFCTSITQAQYHLTMSDATVRNFCSYPCVMSFQSQYSKSPITLPSGEVCPIPTGPNQAMPVISSVTSLAQNGQQTTQAPVSGNVKVNSANVGNKSVLSQQVLVKVQEPKEVRNVYVQCRPYSHTKGVSCRPHPCAKETQTENEGEKKPVLIPVPVPIYVPAPVAMYSYPLPIPVPFPLPVPVPIFVPTTRNSASGIFKEIKRIQEKIPTDPFEAELLMMAAMVAGEKKEAESSSESEDGPEAGETNETCGGSTGETGFSPEAMESSNTFGDDMLQMALKMASELDEPAVDLEAALTPATITPQTSSAVEHNEGTKN